MTPLAAQTTIAGTELMANLLVLSSVLTVAVYFELKEGRIPNWLTVSGMLAGVLLALPDGKAAFFSSFGGLVIGYGFLFLFQWCGGVSGGDAKLMGAVGALVGISLIQPTIFYTSVIGACQAIFILIWQKGFWERAVRGARRVAFWRPHVSEQPLESMNRAVPYGLAIAAGSVLALFLRSGF
jgi:Flp pilus assembly protein protease CpaA